MERYTSPSRLEAERRVLFRRCPVIVGRESELPAPRRFFTHDAAGAPLLVTRDEAGKVHAMLNVCRHRSARLVEDERGGADEFVCKYHGWKYDLVGRLRRPGRVSLPSAVQQFVDDCALVDLPCETRHGFVWVVPTSRVELDVARWLGELDAELTAIDLASHVVASRTTETVASNWKHVVESYVDRSALVLPSSLLVLAPESVTHLAVFPIGVDESLIVRTELAPPSAAGRVTRAAPRLSAGAFHTALDRAIAAVPLRP
jgi:phenylpropionate dioxygenase-like ring-hydroxylating dioxygenase large terminal subunit